MVRAQGIALLVKYIYQTMSIDYKVRVDGLDGPGNHSSKRQVSSGNEI